MARIIRNRAVVEDSWQLLEAQPAAIPADGDVIVPLALWRARRAELVGRRGGLGLRVEPADELDTVAADLGHFKVIAIHFPKFTDGRGYSTARLLRERLGFKGEIRAIGDVLRDNLNYLSRCGFDAFVLKSQDKLEEALASFDDFTEGYQASVERPQPLFRRRLTSIAGGA